MYNRNNANVRIPTIPHDILLLLLLLYWRMIQLNFVVILYQYHQIYYNSRQLILIPVDLYCYYAVLTATILLFVLNMLDVLFYNQLGLFSIKLKVM